MKIFRPIWAEIDCDAVEHNLRMVREKVGPAVKIMSVVKADAYGHGAVAVSKSLLHAGSDCLAVASLEEAVELREAGVTAEILILGYTQPGWASYVVEYGITQTVYHLGLARALGQEAVKQKKTAAIHVKIDTGMSRIGIGPEKALHFIRAAAEMKGVEVRGLYTHLACADDAEDVATENQMSRFRTLLAELRGSEINIPDVHVANSAATLRYPDTYFNMVRPGIILYGLAPSESMRETSVGLRPVMAIKSTVVEIKTVPAGARVSYSGTFEAKRRTRLATLPAGYADGFSRKLSNRGSVLVQGHRAPIVGNVCMDFMVADVTDVPGAGIEDEAVLIGRQGAAEIGVDEIADIIGTINYEVVSLIGKRVRRVYKNYTAGNPNEI